MATRTLQQTLADARRTRASRAAAVGLSIVLVVIGVVMYRGASVPATPGRSASQRAAVAQAHAASPALQSNGLAYDGQPHQGARAAVTGAAHGSPIQMAASSAFDGQSYVAARAAVGRSPIQTAASSAFDGQAARSAPAAAPLTRDIPALRSTGSAYDGQ